MSDKLWERLVRQYEANPSSLREEELTFFAICLLDGETFINGIESYFESSASELYETALAGLKVIGADDYLAVVQRGKALLFGEAEVPNDAQRRAEIIRDLEGRNDEALEAELKDVGRQMFALYEDLCVKLNAYARQHGFLPESAD